MFALVEAIEAQDAFANADLTGRFAATFTVGFTEFAFDAPGFAFSYAPYGEAINKAEQSTEWTYEATVKTRNGKVK